MKGMKNVSKAVGEKAVTGAAIVSYRAPSNLKSVGKVSYRVGRRLLYNTNKQPSPINCTETKLKGCYSEMGIKKELQATLKAIYKSFNDVDVKVFAKLHPSLEPIAKETGVFWKKIVEGGVKEPLKPGDVRNFDRKETELWQKIDELGLKAKAQKKLRNFIKRRFNDTGGIFSIYMRINSQNDPSRYDKALSVIANYFGIAELGGVHVLLRIGSRGFEWVNSNDVVIHEFEPFEDRPFLHIPIKLFAINPEVYDTFADLFENRQIYSPDSLVFDNLILAVVDSFYAQHLFDYPAKFEQLIQVVLRWHNNMEYSMVASNCQHFIIELLQALKIKLPLSASVLKHIEGIVVNPALLSPTLTGATAAEFVHNYSANGSTDLQYSLMAARFFLSDMRNRQFKASGAFAIPLNLTMLGLAEDKLSLDGFMELFSQIQDIHGELIYQYTKEDEWIDRSIEIDAFQKMDFYAYHTRMGRDPPAKITEFQQHVINHLVFQPPEISPQLGDDYYKEFLIRIEGISCAFIPAHRKITTTIIYSHGNGEDIGHCLDYLMLLRENFNVNVISFDYATYGLNEKREKCNEAMTYDYIDTIYKWLHQKGIQQSDIVLYGRSLGTGPTIDLASRLGLIADLEASKSEKACFRMVILESAFLSIFDAAGIVGAFGRKLMKNHNLFKNNEKIMNIRSPILFICGSEDDIVPPSHSIELNRAAVKSVRHEVCMIPGGGHNDLYEDEFLPSVLKAIVQFNLM